mgnify:CR=1 FL=1
MVEFERISQTLKEVWSSNSNWQHQRTNEPHGAVRDDTTDGVIQRRRDVERAGGEVTNETNVVVVRTTPRAARPPHRPSCRRPGWRGPGWRRTSDAGRRSIRTIGPRSGGTSCGWRPRRRSSFSPRWVLWTRLPCARPDSLDSLDSLTRATRYALRSFAR